MHWYWGMWKTGRGRACLAHTRWRGTGHNLGNIRLESWSKAPISVHGLGDIYHIIHVICFGYLKSECERREEVIWVILILQGELLLLKAPHED